MTQDSLVVGFSPTISFEVLCRGFQDLQILLRVLSLIRSCLYLLIRTRSCPQNQLQDDIQRAVKMWSQMDSKLQTLWRIMFPHFASLRYVCDTNGNETAWFGYLKRRLVNSGPFEGRKKNYTFST